MALASRPFDTRALRQRLRSILILCNKRRLTARKVNNRAGLMLYAPRGARPMIARNIQRSELSIKSRLLASRRVRPRIPCGLMRGRRTVAGHRLRTVARVIRNPRFAYNRPRSPRLSANCRFVSGNRHGGRRVARAIALRNGSGFPVCSTRHRRTIPASRRKRNSPPPLQTPYARGLKTAANSPSSRAC